jgi:hypothetical protein
VTPERILEIDRCLSIAGGLSESTGRELVAALRAEQARVKELRARFAVLPIPIRLGCPGCGELHIDEGEFATKPHHTHACQNCGAVWRPAVVCTVGVRFLPGFKNVEP